MPTVAGALPVTNASPTRYRLEDEIGGGAMGEVYRAFDTLLHRRVVLKFLRRDAGTEATRLPSRAGGC